MEFSLIVIVIFIKAIYLFLFLDFQTNKNSLKFYLFVLMRTNMHGVSHDIFYFSSCLEINMFQKLLIFSYHVLAVQRERPQDPTILWSRNYVPYPERPFGKPSRGPM